MSINSAPFDSAPFNSAPFDSAPFDSVSALAERADPARLRGFARAVLGEHTAGHLMASGVRLCMCGAVLDSCLYRALARTRLTPPGGREPARCRRRRGDRR